LRGVSCFHSAEGLDVDVHFPPVDGGIRFLWSIG